VVGVVIYDPDLLVFALELKAPADTGETLEAGGGLVCIVAEPPGDSSRRERVKNVVPPIDPKLNYASLLTVLEEGIGVRREHLCA
jgi:hypothetical protein